MWIEQCPADGMCFQPLRAGKAVVHTPLEDFFNIIDILVMDRYGCADDMAILAHELEAFS